MLTCPPVNFTNSLNQISKKRSNDKHHSNTQLNKNNVTLDLSKNQFPCTCKCLPFFLWISRTTIHLRNKENYFCVDHFETNMISKIDELVVKTLAEKCIHDGPSTTMFSFMAMLFTYTIITLVTVGYRWRHTIHYFYLRIRMNRQKISAILTPEYKYHGFISCDRPGAKWILKTFLPALEPRGLKFCIAQRDFIVGTSIIDNIVHAVSHSRKVILIL